MQHQCLAAPGFGLHPSPTPTPTPAPAHATRTWLHVQHHVLQASSFRSFPARINTHIPHSYALTHNTRSLIPHSRLLMQHQVLQLVRVGRRRQPPRQRLARLPRHERLRGPWASLRKRKPATRVRQSAETISRHHRDRDAQQHASPTQWRSKVDPLGRRQPLHVLR